MDKSKIHTDFGPDPRPDLEPPVDREGTDISHSVGEYLHGFSDGAEWASQQFFKGVLIGVVIFAGARLISMAMRES